MCFFMYFPSHQKSHIWLASHRFPTPALTYIYVLKYEPKIPRTYIYVLTKPVFPLPGHSRVSTVRTYIYVHGI